MAEKIPFRLEIYSFMLPRFVVTQVCWVGIDKKTRVLQAGEQTQQTYWHQVTKWIFLDWSGCQQLVHVAHHERILTLTAFYLLWEDYFDSPDGFGLTNFFFKKRIRIKLPLQSSTIPMNAQYQQLQRSLTSCFPKWFHFGNFWWEPERNTWS